MSSITVEGSHGYRLEALPTEILAYIFSWLEHKHVVRTAILSKTFHGLILSTDTQKLRFQDFWRSLCKTSFRMDEERFKEWPQVICWYEMYNILRVWTKREGFYTLSQAAPWGSLCLFHLEAGKLVGEVLTPSSFTEYSQRLKKECGSNGYRTDGVFDRKVFFEAEFIGGNVFRENGTFCSRHNCQIALEDTLEEGNNRSVNIVSVAASAPCRMTRRHARAENMVLFDPTHVDVPPAPKKGHASKWGFLNVFKAFNDMVEGRRIERLTIFRTLNDMIQNAYRINSFEEFVTNGRVGSSSAEDARAIYELWVAQSVNDTEHMGADILEKMWKVLDVEEFRSNSTIPKMLNFEYVDGPSHELSKDLHITENMPVIKPGLYCGAYHPEMYKKYHKEILLVEYRRYTEVRLDETWKLIHAEVFNEQSADGTLELIRSVVEKAHVTEVVFVVGRKVTGDCHVPAGKCTFGALVHPMLPNPSPGAPEVQYAKSRDKEQKEKVALKVIRRWYGWGTVAYPGFRNPSTVPGILMQLENDRGGNHRFGFFWDSSSDEATVLQWLPIQDHYPWFHR
jgi:hypothetical protein